MTKGIQTAETTLGEIRGIIAVAPSIDEHLTKFAADTAELPNETKVRITIYERGKRLQPQKVTYEALNIGSELSSDE